MKAVSIGVLWSVLLFLVGDAFAGTQVGKVDRLLVRNSDGLVYFYLTGTASNRAAPCATNTTYWMLRNESSETGKRQFSMLLAAQASGREVSVTGSGTCARWGDGEDVETIDLAR